MEIRGVKESELEETIRLQRLVFRPDEGEEAEARYRAYVREDPTYRLDQSRVVLEGGQIVGHLRVWDRLIRVRGAELRAGGIGSLLVHPEFRERGYARALMRDTERYFVEAGYDLGLLFTIIGTPFYEAQGWTPIPLPTFELAVGEGVNAEARGDGVRRLEIGRDLEEVEAIYRSYTGTMTGSEVRKEGYWMSGPSRYRKIFPEWGMEWEGRVVAYVNFEVEKDRVWVKEGCALPGWQTALSDLARVVVDTARSEGCRTVAGSLPPGHPLADRLARVASDRPRWGRHDEMMVKGVHWPSLTKKLEGAIDPPEEERPFWEALFGLTDAPPGAPYRAWMASLPPCRGPFYWWADIF